MTMKFYNQQHGFYCGIDLHANSMQVCVVDHPGNKHVHRNFDTKKTADFLAALQPFQRQDLIIGCESTFKASGRKGITNAAPDAEQPFAIDHVEGCRSETDLPT